MKILLVEDNRDLAENFIEIFTNEGFQAIHAQSGEEAQQKLTPDILIFIIDLRLPDISGLSLLQKVKQEHHNAEAILLTGDADISSAIEAVRAGAFAYLIKPVATPELLLTVERARDKIKLRLLSEELEVALRFSERRYRTIVEMVPALIVALDHEFFIQFANQATEEVSGYSRGELAGKRFREVFGFDANPEHQEFEGSFTNRTQQSYLILWRWTQAISSPDSRQEWLFYVGTDVTKLRKLERERHAADRLAVMGKMTAGLAHEIRNPLNAALLQLMLLSRKQDKLPPELGGPLQIPLILIQSELERLNVLLTDFLSLAKPKEYQKKLVALPDLLSRVISLQQEVAQQHNVSLRLRCPPRLQTLGDIHALQQVFINLIKNAIEAAASAVEVSVSLQGDKIVVEIKDDGLGINKETAEHIFEPFFTTKAQGTGLGLVIVHSIIIAHGGAITISSNDDARGAVARVQLQRA
jgi:PAS domain S-box-containing protein